MHLRDTRMGWSGVVDRAERLGYDFLSHHHDMDILNMIKTTMPKEENLIHLAEGSSYEFSKSRVKYCEYFAGAQCHGRFRAITISLLR